MATPPSTMGGKLGVSRHMCIGPLPLSRALLHSGAYTGPSAFARDVAALGRSRALASRSGEQVSADAPALPDSTRWQQQPAVPPSPRERAAPAWQIRTASYTIARQVQLES